MLSSDLVQALEKGDVIARNDDGIPTISRQVDTTTGVAKTIVISEEGEMDLEKKQWCDDERKQKNDALAKTQAEIVALNTRIGELEANIDGLKTDIKNTEDSLTANVESQTSQTKDRKELNIAYQQDIENLVEAKSLLVKAISVLKEATEDHTEGVFLAASSRMQSQSLAERMQDAEALSHAVELGNKMLTAGDAMFLRRLLTGDVPTWDWKKLNRKATFKMSYKARSFKIQEVLSKMQKTFTASLADAKGGPPKDQQKLEKSAAFKEEEHVYHVYICQKL